MGFRDRKETDVVQLICSVSLIAKTIGILEDDDEHEHEDDSSNSEFAFLDDRILGTIRRYPNHVGTFSEIRSKQPAIPRFSKKSKC